MIELSILLDRMSLNERAVIDETKDYLRISHLAFGAAQQIARLIDVESWQDVRVEDAADSLLRVDALFGADQGALIGPLSVVLQKPQGQENAVALITMAGLRQWLETESDARICRVASLERSFRSWTTSFVPWDAELIPQAEAPFEFCNPRRTVQSFGPSRSITESVGRWLVLSAEPGAEESSAFAEWRSVATAKLLPTLASEVLGTPDQLVFGSSRRVRTTISDTSFSHEHYLGAARLSQWIYEDPRAVDTKHTLASDEIARQLSQDASRDAVLSAVERSMDAAKRAYAFVLQEINRDALAALSDLRALVTEEITRISTLTTQLATAIATALGIGVSLVAARVIFDSSPLLIFALMVVVVAYVTTVAKLGADQIALSEKARAAWRDHLYKFVATSEYNRLVDDPAEMAAKSFRRMRWLGVGVVLSTFLVVSGVALPDDVVDRVAQLIQVKSIGS